MKTFKLHIKNMVCARCIIFVQQVLRQLNVQPEKVELGYVVFLAIDESILETFEKKLNEGGLLIARDKTEVTLEQIKVQIINYLDRQESGGNPRRLSSFLADSLAMNYFSLTKLFSKHEKVTIESYTIKQKIERAKRMLVEDELSLNQISYRLGYCSVQYLSSQFRKITGLSVYEFKTGNRKYGTTVRISERATMNLPAVA